MKKTILPAIMGLLLFASCKKNNVTTPEPITANVFIAGSRSDGNKTTAVYWKNGERVELPSNATYQAGYGIAVSGNDVYVTGAYSGGGLFSGTDAVYWKNSEPMFLSTGGSYIQASDIVISGDDVYILMNGLFTAGYWKNGVTEDLAKSDSLNLNSASGLCVSGTDVYVSGYEVSGNLQNAKYWKNGQPVIISDQVHNFTTSGITVSGDDVYVSGGGYSTHLYAAYWKNNSTVFLGDTAVESGANSIAVSGSDVYVVGYQKTSSGYDAMLWKNGSSVDLGRDGNAYGITISGTDVYVVGSLAQKAVYWKNGQVHYLDGGTEAWALFVKPL